MRVSSRAELGNLGFDPSHLSFVPSSDGRGRKDNVDVTVLEFVEFDIWNGNSNQELQQLFVDFNLT